MQVDEWGREWLPLNRKNDGSSGISTVLSVIMSVGSMLWKRTYRIWKRVYIFYCKCRCARILDVLYSKSQMHRISFLTRKLQNARKEWMMSKTLWCDSGQHPFSSKDENKIHFVQQKETKNKYSGETFHESEEFDICGEHAAGLFTDKKAVEP